MPKRRRRGRGQKKPLHDQLGAGTSLKVPECGMGEDESEGEIDEEDLEGLEVKDMKMISRMGL